MIRTVGFKELGLTCVAVDRHIQSTFPKSVDRLTLSAAMRCISSNKQGQPPLSEVDLVAVSSCLYVMELRLIAGPKAIPKAEPCFLLKISILDGDHLRKCSPSIAHMVATIRANGRRHRHISAMNKIGNTHYIPFDITIAFSQRINCLM